MNWIERTPFSMDWMTISLFLSLFFLALAKYFFQTRFMNFMVLPFNDKYVMLDNKKGLLFNGFHILMTVFQIINLALFIYLFQQLLFSASQGDGIVAFFYILIAVILFQTLKFILQQLKGYVFNTQSFIAELIFKKFSYLNHSSLVLCVANILIIYIIKDAKLVIYGAIILILLINFIGIVKLLKNYQKILIPNIFYFILYLCALEIAPLVVIGSYLKD